MIRPNVLSTGTLRGNKVTNPQGEKLGKIEDIMIDLEAAQVVYAVISSGGFLGMNDKMRAVPWAALQADPDKKCFVLDVRKDQFTKVRDFARNNWPTMSDRTWGAEIHRIFGQQPYWQNTKSAQSQLPTA